MGLEFLGTAGLLISVIATTLFVIGYLFLAPWYRSTIGISLLASKAWMAGLCWLAALGYVFDVSRDSTLYLALRVALWAALPVVSLGTFYALLIKGQVRSHRRRVAIHPGKERSEREGERS